MIRGIGLDCICEVEAKLFYLAALLRERLDGSCAHISDCGVHGNAAEVGAIADPEARDGGLAGDDGAEVVGPVSQRARIAFIGPGQNVQHQSGVRHGVAKRPIANRDRLPELVVWMKWHSAIGRLESDTPHN